MLVLEAHLSSALAAVELNLSGAAAATVAGVLSLAELIELGNNVL